MMSNEPMKNEFGTAFICIVGIPVLGCAFVYVLMNVEVVAVPLLKRLFGW